MYSSFSILIFGVFLISILSENIESKATARSSSKVVECRFDSISCAGRASDGNIDFSYCNKDLDCNNSSHSSVSVCSLGSRKQQECVGGISKISPKIHPKLEEDIEGSSDNPLNKSGKSLKEDELDESVKLPDKQESPLQKTSLDEDYEYDVSEQDCRCHPRRMLRYVIFVGMQDEKICLLYVASAPMVHNTLTVCKKCFRKFLKVIGSVNNASWLRKLKAKSKEPVRSLTSGLRLQTPKGSLLKCSSFNTLNSKPKVKLVMSTTSVPPASNSRLSPLPLEPAGFSYDRGATIDIPLDTASGGSHNQVGKEMSLNFIYIIRLSPEGMDEFWHLYFMYSRMNLMQKWRERVPTPNDENDQVDGENNTISMTQYGSESASASMTQYGSEIQAAKALEAWIWYLATV
ncbi:hypothetical protein F3Y22_tig00113725pilonHSYRG01197 [Hibiscus syriacus]|uniref:Uncharacterized protein n=1 Tax=Hibiscus syriacus TaxID=106335 RepID=A0A6A2Y1H0_HIBSY|nr:hypothetical protein F3Y22_tig00113725pilonHSYRG01197 [Hibiscus syriacus]